MLFKRKNKYYSLSKKYFFKNQVACIYYLCLNLRLTGLLSLVILGKLLYLITF